MPNSPFFPDVMLFSLFKVVKGRVRWMKEIEQGRKKGKRDWSDAWRLTFHPIKGRKGCGGVAVIWDFLFVLIKIFISFLIRETGSPT